MSDESMDCPQCSEPLRNEAYRANPYAICFYCRGAWVPKDSLTAIGVPIPLLQLDRETLRSCPGCAQQLWPGTVADVEVEFCKGCGSIWFDEDELCRVADGYSSETDWGAVRDDLASIHRFLKNVSSLMRLVKSVAR